MKIDELQYHLEHENEIPRDMFGNELKLGDVVVFTPYSNFSSNGLKISPISNIILSDNDENNSKPIIQLLEYKYDIHPEKVLKINEKYSEDELFIFQKKVNDFRNKKFNLKDPNPKKFYLFAYHDNITQKRGFVFIPITNCMSQNINQYKKSITNIDQVDSLKLFNKKYPNIFLHLLDENLQFDFFHNDPSYINFNIHNFVDHNGFESFLCFNSLTNILTKNIINYILFLYKNCGQNCLFFNIDNSQTINLELYNNDLSEENKQQINSFMNNKSKIKWSDVFNINKNGQMYLNNFIYNRGRYYSINHTKKINFNLIESLKHIKL